MPRLLLLATILLLPGDSYTQERSADVARLPAAAARMYELVKRPRPGELRWQEIPWVTDLQEGIRLARAEQRPLLLFVSGDDPLERC